MLPVENEFFDVVIVGAGLSGIGAACHLQRECPNKSFVILEGRDAMGGTWDLFRYPGIRSDSDMHTLGYKFKPWRESKAIADGPSILNYIHETAADYDVDRHIRYRHRVVKAGWSSDDRVWTLQVQQTDTNEISRIRCGLVLMCAGYYRYESGYTPVFEGRKRFRGEIVHPQRWPEDLDYRGKKVLVIGSGATAVTLVPAMAEQAGHVTMLQRSPSYVVSWPDEDKIANFLRKVLPEKVAYAITRWKNITMQQWTYRRTRTSPDKVKRQLLEWVQKELGEDYDVETHFTPDYNPWDQRLCLVANGDLFEAIRKGAVSVVTDQIESFTESGVRLESGKELTADIIITATGLDLLVLGGVEFAVDGKLVDFSKTYSYKGVMYSGVPNLVSTFGYINASWTLRADLTAEYFCRLVKHLDSNEFQSCTPRLRPEDEAMEPRPWITAFTPGYIQRSIDLMPRQGDHAPW
ncbi:MAG: NAD(P)/FAD-dependent oxidoreductase, partial [Woeseiaceae bacterium]|nr:NAD(P)/FAD-dependent oxidoreductase [Woeseiaceae bacterium]